MTMFFARAAVPMWVIAVCLAAGAFFAPAGIARIVLLVAFCLVCIPAAITAGFRKRTLREPTPTVDMMNVWHTANQRGDTSQQGDIIDAEFEARDVTPSDDPKRHPGSPRQDSAARNAVLF